MKIAWIIVGFGLAVGSAVVFLPKTTAEPEIAQASALDALRMHDKKTDLPQIGDAVVTTHEDLAARQVSNRVDETHQMLRVLNGSN